MGNLYLWPRAVKLDASYRAEVGNKYRSKEGRKKVRQQIPKEGQEGGKILSEGHGNRRRSEEVQKKVTATEEGQNNFKRRSRQQKVKIMSEEFQKKVPATEEGQNNVKIMSKS